VLKSYHTQRELLVMPKLFDAYCRPARGSRLAVQPLVTQAIDRLIALRNQFYHPGISEAQIPEKVAAGSVWLAALLSSLTFLQHYHLTFVQRIELRRRNGTTPHYSPCHYPKLSLGHGKI